MRVGSDPLHASVNFHMNRQTRRACSNECVKERPRVDGGSEAVLDNFARTLGRLLAENENRIIDAGPTKRYPLTDQGNAQALSTRCNGSSGYVDSAMAVPVCLDHGPHGRR
jgi:hypothetical protein